MICSACAFADRAPGGAFDQRRSRIIYQSSAGAAAWDRAEHSKLSAIANVIEHDFENQFPAFRNHAPTSMGRKSWYAIP
jgi:hypothetical protein